MRPMDHTTPMSGNLIAPRWWRAGMDHITAALLTDLPLPQGPVVELGCGDHPFPLPPQLASRPKVDLDRRPGRGGSDLGRVRADVHHLPFPSEHFALVLALDVLDQQGVSLPDALAEAWRILLPEGVLLLRVSAYPWLYGPHDVAFGTGQRFSARKLERALHASRFRTVRLTYANTLLLPAAVIARMMQRGGLCSVKRASALPWLVERGFNALLCAEARWLVRRRFFAGLSLYALARKGTS